MMLPAVIWVIAFLFSSAVLSSLTTEFTLLGGVALFIFIVCVATSVPLIAILRYDQRVEAIRRGEQILRQQEAEIRPRAKNPKGK